MCISFLVIYNNLARCNPSFFEIHVLYLPSTKYTRQVITIIFKNSVILMINSAGILNQYKNLKMAIQKELLQLKEQWVPHHIYIP